jgi:hypothetical protein
MPFYLEDVLDEKFVIARSGHQRGCVAPALTR